MRNLLLTVMLWAPTLAAAAAEPAAQEAEIKAHARCYSFYSIAHFMFGSLGQRLEADHYLTRSEITALHGENLSKAAGLDFTVFMNTSLVHRNMMMDQFMEADGNLGVLLDANKDYCENLARQIPPQTLEQYQSLKSSGGPLPG